MDAFAVALASKDILSNFFGSMKIILDESFSQGDWIKTNSVEGTVIEIGLVNTKIRRFDNAMEVVPNGILANTNVANWNRRKMGRRIKMTVGVTYKSKKEDIQKALIELRELFSNHPDIAQPTYKDKSKRKSRGKILNYTDMEGIKNTQLIYLDNMSDSSINILIYVFTKSTSWEKWLQVKEDINFKIWDILENNNLEYAFPTQTIYLEKE